MSQLGRIRLEWLQQARDQGAGDGRQRGGGAWAAGQIVQSQVLGDDIGPVDGFFAAAEKEKASRRNHKKPCCINLPHHLLPLPFQKLWSILQKNYS